MTDYNYDAGYDTEGRPRVSTTQKAFTPYVASNEEEDHGYFYDQTGGEGGVGGTDDYEGGTTDSPETAQAKPKDSELDGYQKLLTAQMAMNKVVEARRSKDANLLERSLKEYNALNLEPKPKEVRETIELAEKKLKQILLCRGLLKQASDERNVRNLGNAILLCQSNHVTIYLRKELNDAKELLEELNAKVHTYNILAMERKTMAEIRSYSKPSPLVHRIMTSALLLLGEDEGTTSNWAKVQSLCNPDGPHGMVRRMVHFDPAKVHPLIIKRARDLIKDVKLIEAQKASPGAATFYVWTKGIVGPDPEDQDEEMAPSADGAGEAEYGREEEAGQYTSRAPVSPRRQTDRQDALAREQQQAAARRKEARRRQQYIDIEVKIFKEQKEAEKEQEREEMILAEELRKQELAERNFQKRQQGPYNRYL